MKRFTLIVLASLLPLLGFAQVFSQTDGDTVGLSLSPAIIEIAGDPNSKHQAQVIVTNTSAKAIPVIIDATSLIPIEDIIDKQRQSEFDASSWVTLDEKNLLLPPGGTATVNAKVDIPKEANPGGHYAQIGFRVVSEANYNPETNAQIIPELSATLLITVSGDVKEQAELVTDNLIPSYVNKGSTTRLSFTIRNTGNVHILPSPIISISDGSKDVKQISMQPQLVLPNKQKNFTVDWPADVGYGKYFARVETIYGSQATPLSNPPTQFRVGPAIWQVVLAVILVLGAVGLTLRRRNLPNAFKILAGKRIHLVSKKRYSRATSDDQPESSASVGDYDAIADFLGNEDKPSPLLKAPDYPIVDTSAEITDEETTEIVIEEAMQKTAQEPLSQVEIAPKTTVTEFATADNPDEKTVIVQTTASTIIRQEPKQEQESEPEPTPTVVRAEVKKPGIKINIIEVDSEAEVVPKPKASQQPKALVTRSEKVAKKAASAKRKAIKKKT